MTSSTARNNSPVAVSSASTAHIPTRPTEPLSDHSSGQGRLLTVLEACAELRISRWSLYELIHRRQLKTIKIGARRLVPAMAIQELVQRLIDEEAPYVRS
jgi:excisionase family DNA binding protein